MKRLLAVLLSFLMLHTSTVYAEDALAMGSKPPTTTPTVDKECPAVPECLKPEKPAISDEVPLRLFKGRTYYLSKDGWFFTDAQEQKLRLKLIDADFLTKELELLKQKVDHYKVLYETEQKITEKYHTAWLESDKQLTETLKRENRTKLWYFIGGILVTVGAGFALGYAAKAVK